jgi:hypothetical protein
MVFDLGSDPAERYNLFNSKMDMGWMIGIAIRPITDWKKSVAEYPNIEPGAEFNGYEPARPPEQRRAPAEKSAAAGAR